MSSEQVRERLKAQMSIQEKRERCDFSILNNSSLEKLEESVERFLSHLPSRKE